MNYRIRLAQPTDAKDFERINLDAVKEGEAFMSYLEEYRWTEEKRREWIASFSEEALSRLFIAVDASDTPQGFLCLWCQPHKRIEHVGALTIAVSKKARRHGIASLLMTEVSNYFQQQNAISRIQLSVISSNQAAIHLYEKFGFVHEGRRPFAFKNPGGDFADEILMGWVKEM